MQPTDSYPAAALPTALAAAMARVFRLSYPLLVPAPVPGGRAVQCKGARLTMAHAAGGPLVLHAGGGGGAEWLTRGSWAAFIAEAAYAARGGWVTCMMVCGKLGSVQQWGLGEAQRGSPGSAAHSACGPQLPRYWSALIYIIIILLWAELAYLFSELFFFLFFIFLPQKMQEVSSAFAEVFLPPMCLFPYVFSFLPCLRSVFIAFISWHPCIPEVKWHSTTYLNLFILRSMKHPSHPCSCKTTLDFTQLYWISSVTSYSFQYRITCLHISDTGIWTLLCYSIYFVFLWFQGLTVFVVALYLALGNVLSVVYVIPSTWKTPHMSWVITDF